MEEASLKRCRFCSTEPIARAAFDQGCFCYPDDREQDLCLHHYMRATPLGTMTLVADYTVGLTFTAWLEAGCPRSPQATRRPGGNVRRLDGVVRPLGDVATEHLARLARRPVEDDDVATDRHLQGSGQVTQPVITGTL